MGRSKESASAGILVAPDELNGGASPDDARGFLTVKGTGLCAVQN